MKHKRKHKLVCLVCGAEFTASRPDAKYCSDLCRLRHHRTKHAPEPFIPDRPVDVADLPTLVNVVSELRMATTDLARISLSGPAPMRAGAIRVADAVTKALEDEGW